MDLGLPSGTLWLDRLVGAQAPNGIGLFYQWGDIVGHSITDGYEFDSQTYEAKGLNLISANLDDEHDAARAYYGPKAKMPTMDHYEELINNCDITFLEDGIQITSRINGASIKIRQYGSLVRNEHQNSGEIHAWSSNIQTGIYAYSLQSTSSAIFLGHNRRYVGCNIMAVHS